MIGEIDAFLDEWATRQLGMAFMVAGLLLFGAGRLYSSAPRLSIAVCALSVILVVLAVFHRLQQQAQAGRERVDVLVDTAEDSSSREGNE